MGQRVVVHIPTEIVFREGWPIETYKFGSLFVYNIYLRAVKAHRVVRFRETGEKEEISKKKHPSIETELGAGPSYNQQQHRRNVRT